MEKIYDSFVRRHLHRLQSAKMHNGGTVLPTPDTHVGIARGLARDRVYTIDAIVHNVGADSLCFRMNFGNDTFAAECTIADCNKEIEAVFRGEFGDRDSDLLNVMNQYYGNSNAADLELREFSTSTVWEPDKPRMMKFLCMTASFSFDAAIGDVDLLCGQVALWESDVEYIRLTKIHIDTTTPHPPFSAESLTVWIDLTSPIYDHLESFDIKTTLVDGDVEPHVMAILTAFKLRLGANRLAGRVKRPE